MKLESERLYMYPVCDNEMKRLIECENDPILKAAYSEMLEGCLMHPEQREWYAIWVIELKDGRHIGELCFKGIDGAGAAEIGYGISAEYEGHGYATEAVTAVVDWALRQPSVTCVEAETDEGNIASQKVLKKSGFVPTGKFGEEGPRFVCDLSNIL